MFCAQNCVIVFAYVVLFFNQLICVECGQDDGVKKTRVQGIKSFDDRAYVDPDPDPSIDSSYDLPRARNHDRSTIEPIFNESQHMNGAEKIKKVALNGSITNSGVSLSPSPSISTTNNESTWTKNTVSAKTSPNRLQRNKSMSSLYKRSRRNLQPEITNNEELKTDSRCNNLLIEK